MAVTQARPYLLPTDCDPTPDPTPDPSGVTITVNDVIESWGVKASDPESFDRAERILEVASDMVTEYAPHAPTSILNEAVVRLGGYLAQSDYGGIREESVGQRSVSYQMNHAMMFRNSGAQALLTRWKARRAGVI